MNVELIRKTADIYIPPVEVIDDRDAMNQMMALHVEQKNFFNALVTDDCCHEDVLEYVEAFVGTSEMDRYIKETEARLTELFSSEQ